MGGVEPLCSLPTPSAALPVPTVLPKGAEVSSGPVSLPFKMLLERMPLERTPMS